MLDAHITANRESVHNTAIQINLVWLFSFNQNSLRLVTFLGGENLVGLGGGDGEWSFDGAEFVFLDKTAICK
jgi:hypothetical protein